MEHTNIHITKVSEGEKRRGAEKEIKKYNIAEVDVLSIVPEKCDLGADKINI